MPSFLYTCLALASTLMVEAAQPTAPEPVAAPMRPLPWGGLNFLQTTDTHGWLAGHLQEAQYSADWGDYISFATQMRKKADDIGVDLLLVDCGDRIEGNGLFDASDPKGKYTYDIFKEQDIDIITTGNHELYQVYSAAQEYNQTVPNFKKQYLASNLDYITPEGKQVPMAQRWRKFTTKHQGIRIAAFGFLFNFKGNNNNSVVQPVEDTIKEQWFQDAIREDVDLFVVAGHVTLHGPEYKALYKAIRSQAWDTPIAFFGGHSHIRNFAKYDSKAYALQGGRYMETVGWLAIEGIDGKGNKSELALTATQKSAPVADAAMTFERRYIDTNLFGYHYHTGLNSTTFPTSKGQNVSKAISKARKAMQLDHKFGCAPKNLWLNRAPYPGPDSLVSWLGDEILPAIIKNPERDNIPTLALANTGSLRFDVFKGPFTTDTTFIVSPFVSKFRFIKDVPFATASKLLALLNNAGQVFSAAGLPLTGMSIPETQEAHNTPIIGPSPQPPRSPKTTHNQQVPLLSHPDLIPGYTTQDAAGSDGDDTLHAPITFYAVPNAIETRLSFPAGSDPEAVDLVFLDFIQPWILLGLKYFGETLGEESVESYMNGTLTGEISAWIGENWGRDC